MNPLNEDNKSQLLESPFECNICLDIATEPMLTTCGHLYCWPCIYAWLNSNQEFLTCPVCKNGCPRNSLIPLYSKNEDHKARPRDPNIPMRPKPDRNEPIRNVQNGGQNNLTNATMVAGYGLFPSLISLVNIKEGEIDKDVHSENDSLIELHNLKFMKALLGIFIGFFCLIVVLYF